jgi:hypothetical protein
MRKIPLLIVLHELCRLCTMQFQRMEKIVTDGFVTLHQATIVMIGLWLSKQLNLVKNIQKRIVYIFAIKNQIVWKNLNIKVEELSFSKNIELFKKLNLYNTKSKSIINQANYEKYVFLDDDDCKDKKNYKDLSSTRGASLFCLLVGQYEDR